MAERRTDAPGEGSDRPLVSALMVTFGAPDRLAFQRLSIADYCRQSAANCELVIVASGGDPGCLAALATHVAGLARPDIRLIDVPGRFPLGELRNMSIDAARGEVICQWDDDDRYHPDRIARQFDALVAAGGRAVLQQEVMQYVPAERRLYCINWRATESRGMPGSLMCQRTAPIRYPTSGEFARLGEDSVVVRQLLAGDGVQLLANAPHLFVYVTHGANSWPGGHHRMLVERLGVSRGILLRREALLRDGLRAFDFGAGPVAVHGYNGLAFTLSPGT
jgi:glycosyltransferase involved in cell wall biosynthesis